MISVLKSISSWSVTTLHGLAAMMEQVIFTNFSHTPAEAIATMKEV